MEDGSLLSTVRTLEASLLSPLSILLSGARPGVVLSVAVAMAGRDLEGMLGDKIYRSLRPSAVQRRGRAGAYCIDHSSAVGEPVQRAGRSAGESRATQAVSVGGVRWDEVVMLVMLVMMVMMLEMLESEHSATRETTRETTQRYISSCQH